MTEFTETNGSEGSGGLKMQLNILIALFKAYPKKVITVLVLAVLAIWGAVDIVSNIVQLFI